MLAIPFQSIPLQESEIFSEVTDLLHIPNDNKDGSLDVLKCQMCLFFRFLLSTYSFYGKMSYRECICIPSDIIQKFPCFIFEVVFISCCFYFRK